MRVRGQDLIQTVRDFFAEAREIMPEVTDEMLCDEGDGEKIYYMNGNDGTDFDWKVNDHLCEFMMFYKETERGFIKVYVNRNGNIHGYIYNNKGKTGCDIEELSNKKCLTEKEVQCFEKLMCQIADRQDLYNEPISRMDFNYVLDEDSLHISKEEV